jgi:hypothetical protein
MLYRYSVSYSRRLCNQTGKKNMIRCSRHSHPVITKTQKDLFSTMHWPRSPVLYNVLSSTAATLHGLQVGYVDSTASIDKAPDTSPMADAERLSYCVLANLSLPKSYRLQAIWLLQNLRT